MAQKKNHNTKLTFIDGTFNIPTVAFYNMSGFVNRKTNSYNDNAYETYCNIKK